MINILHCFFGKEEVIGLDGFVAQKVSSLAEKQGTTKSPKGKKSKMSP